MKISWKKPTEKELSIIEYLRSYLGVLIMVTGYVKGWWLF
jgi:hypothetical protein